MLKHETKILSQLREEQATFCVRKEQEQKRRASVVLSALSEYASKIFAVAASLYLCFAISSAQSAGDDTGSVRPVAEVTGTSVRDLWDRQVGEARLASGSRPQHGQEQGSVVRGLQPGDRLPARRSTGMHEGGYISLAAFCLSLNVYWESRDQSIAGQVAVAQVTMNRVASPDFPDNVCGVVHQLKQFSWQWDGKSDVPQEEAAWDRAQMVARGVLAGSGHVDLMDINITHYHALTVQPYWTRQMVVVARIEDHIFYLD